MPRPRHRISSPMLAALFFLSLSAHVGVWQVFEALVKQRSGAVPRLPTDRPLRVALVDEEPERAEREKIPEMIVKNDRIEREERPEDTSLLSEFDNKVAREQQARLSRGEAGQAGRAASQRPKQERAPAERRQAERSQPDAPSQAFAEKASDPSDTSEVLVIRQDDKGIVSRQGGPTAPQADTQTPKELRSDPESLRGLFGVPGGMDRVEEVEEGQENLFNTRRSRYASFFNRIRDAVAQRWHPEAVHKKRDPYGKIYGEQPRRTVLRVLLNPDGSLHRVYIDSPSGVDYLDEEAVRAMRSAAPFVNPPSQLVDARTGKIEFTFGFLLLIDGTKKVFRYRR